MRNRSETIYATNEADYLKQMNMQEKTQSKHPKKSKLSLFASKIETGNDCLSLGYDFSLQEKPKSMAELEQHEEEKLIETISRLEYSLKNYDRKEFVENLFKLNSESNAKDNYSFKFTVPKRTSSFDTSEGTSLSRSSVSSFLESCSTQPSSNFHQMISQNVEVADNKIKLMVLGDKRVGKSLFINRFLGKDSALHYYYPTESLEVKYHTMNVLGKIVKFEIWDTNVNVLSSSIIKTYFNICDGFILICNKNSLDSISFVETQIENILKGRMSTEGVNIFVIVNEERTNDCEDVDYLSNLDVLLTRKYNIRVNLMDLSKVSLSSDSNLEKFLTNVSLKKSTRHKKQNSNSNYIVKKEKPLYNKGNVKQLNLSLRDISSK